MATEAIVSVVLEQSISIIARKLHQEVRLVANVTKEIEKLDSKFRTIQAVLVDAEQKRVKDKVVADWLDKLTNVSYDVEDVLDEWNTAMLKLQIKRVEVAYILIKKVCFGFPLPRFCFKQVVLRHGIALKIQEINENIDSIAKEKDKYSLKTIKSSEEFERLETTSFVDVSRIFDRDIQKDSLVRKLLSESPVEGKNIPVISIVGMGGIGKTTLAQFVYNDEDVKNNFHKKIWICVSDPFDVTRIGKEIIKGLTNKPHEFVSLQYVLEDIQGSVIETKFLPVLDDVWTEDNSKWEPLYNALNNSLHGSKILVTTRKTTVAYMMKSTDIINIETLSKDGSWLLFKQLAFSGRSQQKCEMLGEIGREIVHKCKGLPLAIKTVGSLLRFKKTREQWKRILDNEMWKLEELEDVFRPLLLSYNDLPFKVKRCFSYCAIYPKDYNIRKDELIKLWMAQGYLGLEQNEDLELIGEDYFENLVIRSFFQEFENDKDGNIIGCKMHDIVHDFALFLVKNDCFAMEIDSYEVAKLNSSYEKVHHLTLIMKNNKASFPLNKFGIQKLRTLLVRCESMQSELLQSNFFKRLTCLRSLEINITSRWWPIEAFPKQTFPKEVGKLIHLRYLYLNFLNIKKLPDTLCDLFNLQTLYIIGCDDLINLPQGIGKLVNLRHLILVDNRSLKYLPKGVERLTNLQTLRELKVDGGTEVCRLDCLENLNHLRGQLTLKGLSSGSGEGEAKKAQLKNKKNIVGLHLHFSWLSEASSKKDEAVLEALESPPNLKELEINHYEGIAFPNWVVSLAYLKQIKINIAIKCEYLPALGKLPLLETLNIRQMSSLKRVGNEFLGVENSSRASSSSSPPITFPLLKELSFDYIREREEWEYENRKDIIIMPSLSQLTIEYCPNLKALPDHLLHSTSLKQINIVNAFKGEYLPALGKLPFLETLEIRYMSRLKRVGNEFLGVENSSSASSSSSPVIAFPLLKELRFYGILEWEKWEYESIKDIIIMPSLSELTIHCCPKLKALPDHLLPPTSLKKLQIYGSSLLEDWCQTKGIRFTGW